MSHFTVLVITNGPEDVESALAPYQENNMGDCPKEYLTFNSVQGELDADWDSEDLHDGYMDEGKFYFEHSSRDLEEKYGSNWAEQVEKVSLRLNQIYVTIDEMVTDYHGYREKDPETSEYGYWENPNRKWDWWAIGGRWTGFFKMKPDVSCITGEPGVFMQAPKPGYADQALKRDIDFEGMLADAEKEANETFDKVEDALKDLVYADSKPLTWHQVRAQFPDRTVEQQREIYGEQPVLRALKAAKLDRLWDCEIETFHLHEDDSRAKYVADRRCAAFSTFAVLYEGNWYEKGDMGWFGMVSDEKSKYDWSAQFMDIIDSLPDTACLTVCDCHI